MNRAELINTLKQYREILREKNTILARLSSASDEMCATLESLDTDAFGLILDEREAMCRELVEFAAKHNLDRSLISGLISMAQDSSDTAEYAGKMGALNEDNARLEENILAKQKACEEILALQMKAASSALKNSSKKRSLVHAYSPAHRKNTRTPVYIDKAS